MRFISATFRPVLVFWLLSYVPAILLVQEMALACAAMLKVAQLIVMVPTSSLDPH